MPSVVTKSPDDTHFVAAASPGAVADALRGMTDRLRTKGTWLGAGHPYRGDVVPLISVKTPPHRFKVGAISQYIAASCFLHCFDGWNYLARAYDALARGDRSTVVHLGYYAELRAGMAILASQGIGIFDTKHFAVAGPARGYYREESRKRTHPMVWAALREWAERPGGATILEHIQVENRTLAGWLDDVKASTMVKTQLTKDWLASWSIDLELYKGDQRARNEMSYRPQSIRWPHPQPLRPDKECVEPILGLWEALEPSALGSANVLDKHLLREALERAYRSNTGRAPSGPKYAAYLGQLEPYASPSLLEFLRRDVHSQKHLLFELAGRKSRLAPNILSRAALLLRLASATGAGLLAAAGLGPNDLKFWWKQRIDDFGLWDGVGEPTSLTDLWGEVEIGVEEVEAWVSNAATAPTSRETCFFLGERIPATQFQRGALWLMANG